MRVVEITEENVGLLSLWLDEHISDNKIFVNSTINKKTICNYSFLRESIFAGRIWCCTTIEDAKILDVLMINMPESHREKVKSGEVLIYYSNKEDFMEFAIKAFATTWNDEIRKIKFIKKYSSVDESLKIKGLVREVCIEINKEFFCVDSFFVNEECKA